MSNPKVWELWLGDVAAQLAKDPNRALFNASSNDGWMSGHCVCKNCSAWDHPDGEAGVLNFPRLYTAERLRAAEAHLQRGAAAVASGPERYRQRVEFVRAGLTFTQRLVEIITLMRGYWQKPDETIGAQVRKNWEAIERHCAEHPYAVNRGPVRPGTPRMLGLHPDHPNPKLNKQKPNRKPPAKDLDQN